MRNKTILCIIKTGTQKMMRFQMGEMTDFGVKPYASYKAFTATDIENTIDNMIKTNPDKYVKARDYTP